MTPPSPLAWILLLSATAAGVVAVVKARRSGAWGFREAVKNPRAYLARLGAAGANEQRLIDEARTWSAEELAAKVRWFVLELPLARQAHAEKKGLLSLGDKTRHAVLDLLGDPGLHARLITPTGEDPLPETPFHRVALLLNDDLPAKAIPAVLPFADAQEKGVRKQAALLLGETGHPDALPALRTAFADDDQYVRSFALMGILRAVARQALPPEYATSLFPEVRRLLAEGKNADDAARLLLHLDQRQAVDFFLSEAIFSPSSPVLHEALKTLTAAGVTIPRDKLLGLVAALREKALKYPEMYLLGEALQALGRHRQAEDRPLLEALLAHPEERVAEGAGTGLLSSHGLEDFEKRLWEKEESSGYAALTPPQRHYSAVSACDAQINNGGLAQYFFNSSGDRWKDALAGFEAMGLAERAGILRQALAFFGESGPGEDRDRRMDQLSRLFRKNDRLFSALESRYYASKEVVEVGVTRYVLAHPEAFQ